MFLFVIKTEMMVDEGRKGDAYVDEMRKKEREREQGLSGGSSCVHCMVVT
jgi:hypothetical protein